MRSILVLPCCSEKVDPWRKQSLHSSDISLVHCISHLLIKKKILVQEEHILILFITLCGCVTDITYPPYTPWGIRRLWGLGGLELFGNVDIYW
jgi:hypothetical protein